MSSEAVEYRLIIKYAYFVTFYIKYVSKYYGVLYKSLPSWHNGILNAEFSLPQDFERHSFTRFCENCAVLILANT